MEYEVIAYDSSKFDSLALKQTMLRRLDNIIPHNKRCVAKKITVTIYQISSIKTTKPDQEQAESTGRLLSLFHAFSL